MERSLIKYYLNHVVLLLILIAHNKGYCQDFRQDLKTAGELYQKKTDFSSDLTIEVQYTENGPMQIYQKAKIRKKSNNFYYTLGGNTTVVTSQLLIMVNEANKSIFFRELVPSEREAITRKYYNSGIDSIASAYDSVKYSGIEKYGKHYIVYSLNSTISRTDIFVDVTTGLINRVVYDYNQKMTKAMDKVVVSFSYPELKPEDEKFLKQETYLLKIGTQYKPAQKYLNYELNKVDNE